MCRRAPHAEELLLLHLLLQSSGLERFHRSPAENVGR